MCRETDGQTDRYRSIGIWFGDVLGLDGEGRCTQDVNGDGPSFPVVGRDIVRDCELPCQMPCPFSKKSGGCLKHRAYWQSSIGLLSGVVPDTQVGHTIAIAGIFWTLHGTRYLALTGGV
jgi:hypothetical protein